MKIEIYGKKNCPLCDAARRIVGEEMGFAYHYRDLATAEGLTEYCYNGYDVKYQMAYPVIVVEGKDFRVIGEAVRYLKDSRTEAESTAAETPV